MKLYRIFFCLLSLWFVPHAHAGYAYCRAVKVDHTLIGSADLSNFVTGWTTLHAAGLQSSPSSSSATITVSTGAGKNILNNDYIKIDSEIMLVTAGQGTTTLTVTRGQKSTTAASHTTGANITSMILANLANGNGVVTSASGYDIAWFSDNACTTLLNFERAAWSATTGVGQFWYQQTQSHSADTTAYLGFSNSAITSEQGTCNTWNDGGSNYYSGVWHLEESGLNYLDSTCNHNDANSGTAPTQATGQIGNGQTFNGSTQYIEIPNSSTMDCDICQFTFSVWAKVSSNGGIFEKRTGGGAFKGFFFDTTTGTANIQVYLMQDVATSAYYCLYNTSINAVNNWTNWVVTASSSGSGSAANLLLYGNGNNISTTQGGCPNATITSSTNTAATDIGRVRSLNNTYLTGTLDELRWAKGVTRTAGWISADNSNQTTPDTFYSSVSGGALPAPSYLQNSFASAH